MHHLMRVLAQLGLMVFAIAAFFVITIQLATWLSYYKAETYGQGAEPKRPFPVVAVAAGSAPAATTQYRLVYWHELKKDGQGAANPGFMLPEMQGRFSLPPRFAFEPQVKFNVIERTKQRQVIEVTLVDDDYTLYSRYATDGTSVQPLHLRAFGASWFMVAVPPGLLLTGLLMFGITWWREKRSARVNTKVQ